MREWAEFDIQGNIAKIDASGAVVRVDVAANYSRKNKDTDEWENDAHFNRVTFFGDRGQRVSNYGVGDLIHICGRVRQSSYEKDGQRHYAVDLIADDFGRVLKRSEAFADEN